MAYNHKYSVEKSIHTDVYQYVRTFTINGMSNFPYPDGTVMKKILFEGSLSDVYAFKRLLEDNFHHADALKLQCNYPAERILDEEGNEV